MKVIVGLGNPGKKYDNTRHNIGFEALDYIADKESISINTGKHKALIGTGYMGGEKAPGALRKRNPGGTEGDTGKTADIYELKRGESSPNHGFL